MKEKIKRFGWFMIGFLLMMGTHVMAADSGAVVTDHYREVIYLEPYSVEVCSQEQQLAGDILNGAIWGAIFGAIIGDVIDDEDGRVPGAVVGALIGAESEEQKGTVVTTAMVCKTETRKNRVVRNEYAYSTIEFEYEGSWYDINFTKR